MRTREELAERLDELKRSNVPRASLERVDRLGSWTKDERLWSEIVPADLHPTLNRYLRHFAWLERERDDEVEVICPGCDSMGFFGWGIVHGSGNCACGWPATLYHVVYNDSDKAECERCSQTKKDHVPQSFEMVSALGGPPITRHDMLCQGARSSMDSFKAPLILKFDVLLWAHPYEVHLPKGEQ